MLFHAAMGGSDALLEICPDARLVLIESVIVGIPAMGWDCEPGGESSEAIAADACGLRVGVRAPFPGVSETESADEAISESPSGSLESADVI